jgi:LmbE family N-acetylglucosaminyl deacetylase
MVMTTLAGAISRQEPLVVLSPHLDDAVLSCGTLMLHAAGRTEIKVVTIFTEAGPAPYTLSARRYLRQVEAGSASELYRQRQAEDLDALDLIGARYLHAGLPEALFRRRPVGARRRTLARWLPEAGHIYPVYRTHVTSGRIASADAVTVNRVSGLIDELLGDEPAIVLAPLGVGGHVDHVLVRTAAARSAATVFYYSDFPYNQRHRPDASFLRRNLLTETAWPGSPAAKTDLIRTYRTQLGSLFQGGHIPLAPEVFFSRT